MINEEAIRHLQAARLMLLGKDNQPISDLYYAIDAGIEALEQTQPQDGDRAISLNAVHDLIATWLDDYLSEETREALETIDGKIDDMPSVTPQPQDGHWIEDAETYYKALNEYGCVVDEYTPYFTDDIACSECLAKYSTIDNETQFFKFCPNCGARMGVSE